MHRVFHPVLLLMVLQTALWAQSHAQPAVFSPPNRSSMVGFRRCGFLWLDESALSGMESAIAKGDFKKITSIVIARHGRLVYEAYFDRAGDTLRDTRSATKSITSMLAGIALDQKMVPALDVKVVGYFPEKQPLANPDTRKAAISLEDLLNHEFADGMR